MADTHTDSPVIADAPHPMVQIGRMLWRDKLALIAAIFLLIVLFYAIFGPALLGDVVTKQNLRGRNAPPFDFSRP